MEKEVGPKKTIFLQSLAIIIFLISPLLVRIFQRVMELDIVVLEIIGSFFWLIFLAISYLSILGLAAGFLGGIIDYIKLSMKGKRNNWIIILSILCLVLLLGVFLVYPEFIPTKNSL